RSSAQIAEKILLFDAGMKRESALMEISVSFRSTDQASTPQLPDTREVIACAAVCKETAASVGACDESGDWPARGAEARRVSVAPRMVARLMVCFGIMPSGYVSARFFLV